MALILNIDTATELGGICLADEGKVIAMAENPEQKDHASWLHPAIEQMLNETGYKMKDLKAVGITEGPGSYTGLRVGMAAAKGFCFALGIPLIAENTLKVMAFAACEQTSVAGLLCPMIDARRMEVFTALYSTDLVEIMPAKAMVVETSSFADWLEKGSVSFFGGGSYKCKPITTAPGAAFIEINYNSGYLGILSFLRYLRNEFTGLIYSEPAYTKEFYTHTKK